MTFRPVATAPVDLCAAVALLNVKYLPVVESATWPLPLANWSNAEDLLSISMQAIKCQDI